ncbi:MAG: phage antirepressor KilAC domain-containing protein [Bacteroidota bacterium]
MTELIKISEHEGQKVVSARELHSFLEVTSRFNDWITNRLAEYGFEEGLEVTKILVTISGQKAFDYALTLDAAKELSMVERNEKGKAARRYFIECEKIAQSVPAIAVPQSLPEALRAYALEVETRMAVEAKLLEAQPKVDFFDTVTQSQDEWDMAKVAKVINVGIGRNTMFKILRQKQVLNSVNNPYQRYVSAGYFRMATTTWNDPLTGVPHVNAKTVVTQKGVDFIRRTLTA